MLSFEEYKNIIDLSCPPRRAQIISEEEKSAICDELLAFLLEERNRIAAFSYPYSVKRELIWGYLNERPPAPVSERFLTLQDRLFLSESEERGVGGRAVGDDAFFVAFAVNAEGVGAEVGIVQVQADEFGTAQSTAIEQLQRHAVAEGVEVFAVDGLNQFVEFDFGERFGEALGAFGGRKRIEGRGLDTALVKEPVEEGADGGGVLGEGGGSVASTFLEAAKVFGEEGRVHVRPVADAPAAEVVEERREGVGVGGAGGGGEAAGVLRGI